MSKADLDNTAHKIKLVGAELIKKRLHMGALPTREFREWCDKHNMTITEGVDFAGGAAPWPFPMQDPYKCTGCGNICEADLLDEVQHRGENGCLQDFTQCRECGGYDCFVPADLCKECDSYPCICEENNDETNI